MSSVRPQHAVQNQRNQRANRSVQTSTESREILQQNTTSAPDITFTPYRNKNLSLCLPVGSEKSRKRSIKKLKCLANTNWHIFFVSPLFNWNYQERYLKFYARRLKEKIIAKHKSELGTFEVTYDCIPDLHFHDSDDRAVKILVHEVCGKGMRKLMYYGILLSWGVHKDLKPAGCTFLPLLLWRGHSGVANLVHSEFQEIHDCVVSQKSFEDEDIRCIIVGYFATLPIPSNKSLYLSYFVPKHRKSEKILITLSTDCLSLLWKCVCHSDANKWTMEEVNVMWEDIHHHIRSCFGIDPDYVCLDKAKLGGFSLSSTLVRGEKIEEMNLVLCYLMGQCIALESVAPNLHRTL